MESSVSSPADPSSTDTSSTDTPVSTSLTSLSCAIPSLTAPSEGNWGLSFQQDGQLPTGNATIESLKKYDAYYAKDTDEKVIFLTFDAGYENGNTPAILDALKKHQVKATFFCCRHLHRIRTGTHPAYDRRRAYRWKPYLASSRYVKDRLA